MRVITVIFILLLLSISSFSQTTPASTDDDFKGTKKRRPGVLKPHALGLIAKDYLGLGVSYRFHPLKKIGFQTSYSPKMSGGSKTVSRSSWFIYVDFRNG